MDRGVFYKMKKRDCIKNTILFITATLVISMPLFAVDNSDKQSPTFESDYSKFLELQSHLYYQHIVKSISPYIFANKPLLDAGCGPGYFAAHLIPVLKEKGVKYEGIDISEKFIAQAQFKFSKNKFMQFRHKNFLEYSNRGQGTVLLTMVAEHIGDIKAILKNSSAILQNKGRLIIVDDNGIGTSAIKVTPELKELKELWNILNGVGKANGRNAFALNQAVEFASEFKFKVIKKENISVSINPNANNGLFLEYCKYLNKLVMHVYKQQINPNQLENSLIKWSANANAHVISNDVGFVILEKYLDLK